MSKIDNEALKATAEAWAAAGGDTKAAAKKLKIADSTCRARLREARVRGLLTQPQAEKQANGRSLQDFRSEYDKDYIVPRKIKAALAALGDGWEYEVQFAKIAKIGLLDLANYRDQFSDHVVVVNRDGRRAWAGTVAIATKMREMVGR